MPWNRRSNVAQSITPSSPVRDKVMSSMDVAHIMERKIYSDLTSERRKQPEDAEVFENPITPFRSQSIGVPESGNRKLPGFFLQEEGEERLRPGESRGIQWSPVKLGPSIDIDSRDPLVSTTEASAHTDGSAPLRKWAKFGRRPRRHSFQNSKTHSTASAPSESQSSLSQVISYTPSPSYSSKSGTPEHCRSFYPYAPYSHREAYAKLSHSPHTFGMPTPPQSRPSSRGETHYNFKQTPPPLPPLDHPAFRERVDEFGVLSGKQHTFPVAEKVARNTHSLPSIAHAKQWTNSTGRISKKKSRKRSQSSIGIIKQDEQFNPRTEVVRKGFHSRTSSKTSFVSSRRSSAEYSAKQASSLDHDGCWEVDVSKAIINLSLQEKQVVSTRSRSSSAIPMTASASGAIAFPGHACGYNKQPSNRVIALGSPFFLQNPSPRNLIDNSVYNDQSKTVKTRDRVREARTEVARDESIKMMMAHGEKQEPVTSITISSTKPTTPGKPKQSSLGSATPSVENTPSRRTGEKAEASSSLLVPQLSIIGPTPEASPISPITPTRRVHHKSTPTMPKSFLPPVIEKSFSSGSVKRKAEEAGVDGDKASPPKETKEHRAKFAPDPRRHRLSAQTIAHAPSSFNRSKRVRLTNASEGGRSTMSRTSHLGSVEGSPSPPSAKNTGSLSSRGSHGPRSGSYLFAREGPPLARSASYASHSQSVNGQGHRAPSRRSLSQASIPISALVSPHAPSVSHSGKFHMRDPRKPPPVQGTPWTLGFPTHCQEGESRWALQSWVARGGSPLHAWLFFIGFIVFPLWWVAAFLTIPRTRRLGGSDTEKGVVLDDPQVEHDAKSWRFRCRAMALVSLITYVPFIVLIVIFTRH